MWREVQRGIECFQNDQPNSICHICLFFSLHIPFFYSRAQCIALYFLHFYFKFLNISGYFLNFIIEYLGIKGGINFCRFCICIFIDVLVWTLLRLFSLIYLFWKDGRRWTNWMHSMGLNDLLCDGVWNCTTGTIIRSVFFFSFLASSSRRPQKWCFGYVSMSNGYVYECACVYICVCTTRANVWRFIHRMCSFLWTIQNMVRCNTSLSGAHYWQRSDRGTTLRSLELVFVIFTLLVYGRTLYSSTKIRKKWKIK